MHIKMGRESPVSNLIKCNWKFGLYPSHFVSVRLDLLRFGILFSDQAMLLARQKEMRHLDPCADVRGHGIASFHCVHAKSL